MSEIEDQLANVEVDDVTDPPKPRKPKPELEVQNSTDRLREGVLTK